MKFAILRSDGTEGAYWSSLIRRLKPKDQDIHFLPEYGNIYQETYGHEPRLAFYGDQDRFIIQPFVKRVLNDLPFLKEQQVTEPYYDIANPYGYGGPVCGCDSLQEALALFEEFNRHLTGYCEEELIASEFTSLHPLLKNHELMSASGLVELAHSKEVVYIDLSRSEEELWKGLNRGHRSSISKAKRSGVTIEKLAPTPELFRVFTRLHLQTMKRNGAAARWFFPEAYFQNCFELLGPDRVSLFFAHVNGEVASAYLLMHDFATAYYHFGGSEDRFYEFRPNNVLMYEVALWAKRQGYLRYHLGGGVSSAIDDSLLRYKSGFSDRRASLYTYSRIHHKATYDYLCELKKNHETATNGALRTSDYFPLYRR